MNWHFPRLSLAKQVLGMFDSGLSTALVFFAPRRMGKTEFLLEDVQPLAKREGYQVFYHSFLDASKNAEFEFTKSLQQHLQENDLLTKSKKAVTNIKNIRAGALGIQGSIELHAPSTHSSDFREMLKKISKKNPLVLLMDEIQALVKNNEVNLPFITSLRTVLDTNKENIKVIFTGSSREGLKKMFSAKDAPFFHFGQNLSFPQFGPEFIEHLAKQYHGITHRNISETTLWNAFEELGKMPQLIRALVERLVLHPELSIDQAKNELLEELAQDQSFDNSWDNFSSLEQLILLELASENHKIYSIESRNKLATKLGLDNIPVSSIQAAMRKLNKNCIIGHAQEHGEYFIDDPNFQDWILQK